MKKETKPEPKVLRLADLTPAQRRLILALLDAVGRLPK
jgi:hypothetical protein